MDIKIQELRDKDPEFDKGYAKIEESRERIRKRLSKMSQEEIDKELGRKWLIQVIKNLKVSTLFGV